MKNKIGRPRLPESKKRRLISVKLPPKIIDFLRSQERSQSDLIIEALRRQHKI